MEVLTEYWKRWESTRFEIHKHTFLEGSMKLFKLGQSVALTGRDHLGRKSELLFTPTYPHKNGFFWRHTAGAPAVPISAEFAAARSRRISLEHGEQALNIYEHIGALRWAGLDGIEISCSSDWPPYFGRTLELYKALSDYIVQMPDEMRWCTVDSQVRIRYTGEPKRFTALYPTDQPRLNVVIICDYPGMGRKELNYIWPHDLMPAFSSFTQGWPSWAYYPSQLAGLFGWPHAKRICWKQRSRESTLEMFCLYRLTDLLGGLSLIHPTRFFAGTVVSYCSGHWADIHAIKLAQSHLRLL
jgi:hypothetical protein